MRNYAGVRPKLAQELAGFTGAPRVFRAKFGDPALPIDGGHRLYSALDMRRIRMSLLGIDDNSNRPLVFPPLINVRMAKGGTGKTTISGNVGSCLSTLGYKTLMIDGDPQASLSEMYGINTDDDIVHIGEIMRRASKGEPTKICDSVYPIYSGGMLDLIAADITMAASDEWLIGALRRERTFENLLQKEIAFFSQYDAILIDSAPSSSLLTTAFMMACKTVLAVVTPEGQAIKALKILESNIMELNQAFPEKSLVPHIVINRYNQTKKPHQEAVEELLLHYKPYLNNTIVRDFVGFLREIDYRDGRKNGPVLEHEPGSVGARDIIELTKSLIVEYDIKLQARPLV